MGVDICNVRPCRAATRGMYFPFEYNNLGIYFIIRRLMTSFTKLVSKKKKKIYALQLTEAEWDRVKIFCDLLSVCIVFVFKFDYY
jgi:hypothetical protein